MRFMGFKGLEVRLDAHGKIKGLGGIVERAFVNNKAYCNCRAIAQALGVIVDF